MHPVKLHALSATLFLSLLAAASPANADDEAGDDLSEEQKAATKAPLPMPQPPQASPPVVAAPGIGIVSLAHEPKWKQFRDAEARALVRQAFDLEQKGKRLEALEVFREAHEKFASAAVDAELGLAELRAGHFVLGLRALDLALDRYALKILPRSEQFYRDIMAEARKEVGTINVAVTVDQAIVDVDGETIRNWPFFDRIYVMPGKHEVKAMRLGYYSSHSNVTIVAGETREVTLALQPRVSTELIPIPVEKPVPVQFAAQTSYPTVEERTWPTTVGIASAIVATVGGGFLVTGLVKGGQADQDVASCRATPSAWGCEDIASITERRDMWSSMALGGGLGMAAGLGGVTVAVIGRVTAPTPMPHVTIEPQFHGKNGAGAVVRGTF